MRVWGGGVGGCACGCVTNILTHPFAYEHLGKVSTFDVINIVILNILQFVLNLFLYIRIWLSILKICFLKSSSFWSLCFIFFLSLLIKLLKVDFLSPSKGKMVLN